eukprot:TRINITY_DN4622_c0_g1_i2.p1 TRINITY_DN4622_c0_g1~~TRINITY_DN4622_c0_g1_i2.p1  ORF type:complete len:883 (-),score=191.64 TRINITY_DN4622_c0_g1_i2:135-2783(-)
MSTVEKRKADDVVGCGTDHLNFSNAAPKRQRDGVDESATTPTSLTATAPLLATLGLPSFGSPSPSLEAEYYVKQHLVGWIIGKGGATLREIQASYGVTVGMDQTTKDRGFSRLTVGGDAVAVQTAAEHINASLARAVAGPGGVNMPDGSLGPFLLDAPPTSGNEDPMVEDYRIDQRFVGWLVGKGGVVLREIEMTSGCRISIKQDTRQFGYSKAVIHGPDLKRQHAKQLITESLDRAGDSGVGERSVNVGGYGGAPMESGGYAGLGVGDSTAVTLPSAAGMQALANPSVALSGGTSPNFCGASNDYSMGGGSSGYGSGDMQSYGSGDMQGYGSGDLQNQFEWSGTQGSGEELRGCVLVDQKWVGWLIGRGGGVSREIEQETGTRIKIDQNTKHLGYSTILINGEASQVELAKTRIARSLGKVGGAPMTAQAGQDGLPVPMPVPTGGRGGFGAGVRPSVAGNGICQLQVEQQWIGWLVGKGGSVIKEIEGATGAKIAINQDCKSMGFSIVNVTGDALQIQGAQDMISDQIRRVSGGGGVTVHSDSTSGDMNLGVGLGGGGPGAGVGGGTGVGTGDIDPALSLAIAQIAAASGQPGLATQLQALLKASSSPQPAEHKPEQLVELQLEQKWVGWLLGSRGKTVREIEGETGAKIGIDQSTKEMGYSVLKLTGTVAAVQRAQARIESSLSLVSPSGQPPPSEGIGSDYMSQTDALLAEIQGANGYIPQIESSGQLGSQLGMPVVDTSSQENDFQVEQKHIGWLLGRSGVVLKEIETQCGARISIDQTTKELGFSTVKIRGGWQECQLGRTLIEGKIAQANPGHIQNFALTSTPLPGLSAQLGGEAPLPGLSAQLGGEVPLASLSAQLGGEAVLNSTLQAFAAGSVV